MFLDVSYGSCFWNGIVGAPQTHSQDVENRFTIPCIDLGYFLDYYQQYSNIQRGYNTELRQAQLEKQLIDGVGDVVASTLWHGTSSGAPAPNATGIKAAIPATSMYGIAGGAIGGNILDSAPKTGEYQQSKDSQRARKECRCRRISQARRWIRHRFR